MSLVVRDLIKSYSQGEQEIRVLKGLNVEVKPSEVIAVRGESGSGKSTLLSLLAGLDQPTSGSILVDGAEITKLNQNEMTRFRADHMAFVFQQFHLMPHLSALENVMLPLEIKGASGAQKKAHEALEKMGLGHRNRHFPSQMSGGECQRVAIARALVAEPKILFADEPSGNLDVETGRKVMSEFFRRVRELKMTTLVVTHGEEVAAECDRSLRITDGVLR